MNTQSVFPLDLRALQKLFLRNKINKTMISQNIESPNSSYKDKGKAIPLQALTGPEGSRSLRIPDFKTIGKLRW
jgi:hypothetical protein